ncbi:unnamed protein product [Amoebophrya sp. A25]|nr:unnamed protein product [Amoebophrya sp. A25]|eukprot:GSA25T00000894001.1
MKMWGSRLASIISVLFSCVVVDPSCFYGGPCAVTASAAARTPVVVSNADHDHAPSSHTHMDEGTVEDDDDDADVSLTAGAHGQSAIDAVRLVLENRGQDSGGAAQLATAFEPVATEVETLLQTTGRSVTRFLSEVQTWMESCVASASSTAGTSATSDIESGTGEDDESDCGAGPMVGKSVSLPAPSCQAAAAPRGRKPSTITSGRGLNLGPLHTSKMDLVDVQSQSSQGSWASSTTRYNKIGHACSTRQKMLEMQNRSIQGRIDTAKTRLRQIGQHFAVLRPSSRQSSAKKTAAAARKKTTSSAFDNGAGVGLDAPAVVGSAPHSQTASTRSAPPTFAKLETSPMWTNFVANVYADAPEVKSVVIARSRALARELGALLVGFAEAQKRFELAKLASKWKGKQITTSASAENDLRQFIAAFGEKKQDFTCSTERDPRAIEVTECGEPCVFGAASCFGSGASPCGNPTSTGTSATGPATSPRGGGHVLETSSGTLLSFVSDPMKSRGEAPVQDYRSLRAADAPMRTPSCIGKIPQRSEPKLIQWNLRQNLGLVVKDEEEIDTEATPHFGAGKQHRGEARHGSSSSTTLTVAAGPTVIPRVALNDVGLENARYPQWERAAPVSSESLASSQCYGFTSGRNRLPRATEEALTDDDGCPPVPSEMDDSSVAHEDTFSRAPTQRGHGEKLPQIQQAGMTGAPFGFGASQDLHAVMRKQNSETSIHQPPPVHLYSASEDYPYPPTGAEPPLRLPPSSGRTLEMRRNQSTRVGRSLGRLLSGASARGLGFTRGPRRGSKSGAEAGDESGVQRISSTTTSYAGDVGPLSSTTLGRPSITGRMNPVVSTAANRGGVFTSGGVELPPPQTLSSNTKYDNPAAAERGGLASRRPDFLDAINDEQSGEENNSGDGSGMLMSSTMSMPAPGRLASSTPSQRVSSTVSQRVSQPMVYAASSRTGATPHSRLQLRTPGGGANGPQHLHHVLDLHNVDIGIDCPLPAIMEPDNAMRPSHSVQSQSGVPATPNVARMEQELFVNRNVLQPAFLQDTAELKDKISILDSRLSEESKMLATLFAEQSKRQTDFLVKTMIEQHSLLLEELQKISKNQVEFEEKRKKQFGILQKRLEQLSVKIDNVDGKITVLDSKVDHLDDDIHDLESDVGDVAKTVNSIMWSATCLRWIACSVGTAFLAGLVVVGVLAIL